MKEVRCPTCGQVEMVKLPSIERLEKLFSTLVPNDSPELYPRMLAQAVVDQLIEWGYEDVR